MIHGLVPLYPEPTAQKHLAGKISALLTVCDTVSIMVPTEHHEKITAVTGIPQIPYPFGSPSQYYCAWQGMFVEFSEPSESDRIVIIPETANFKVLSEIFTDRSRVELLKTHLNNPDVVAAFAKCSGDRTDFHKFNQIQTPVCGDVVMLNPRCVGAYDPLSPARLLESGSKDFISFMKTYAHPASRGSSCLPLYSAIFNLISIGDGIGKF